MKNLLERMFGSRTRVKLLTLFLRNPNESFYVRELTRKLKERINSIRRELNNLAKIGLLVSNRKDFKRFYKVNANFSLFDELRTLFVKATATPKEKLAGKLKRVGRISYACLSGTFTRSPSKVDLFVVGDAKKEKLHNFVKWLEKEQGQEVNYTVMSKNEFEYRKELGDRFIKTILENEKIDLAGSYH
jgi:vacuolar-type H+-ATPase subunit I/STV1